MWAERTPIRNRELPSNDSDSTSDQAEVQVELTIEEPVVLPIEDYLDLHTFQPREVKELLDDYLDAARANGFQEVLIIHGKGQGTLRKRVRAILSTHPKVIGFHDAEPGRGGWGATVVRLVNGLAVDHEGNASSSATTHPAEANESDSLHELSRSQLMIGGILGLGLGAFFYQVLLSLGADSMPTLIFPYGLCISYGLIHKADNLAQVARRFSWASLVLGSLWLGAQLIKQVLFG